MAKLVCPHCGTPAAFTPIFISRDEVFDYVTGTEEAASNPRVIKAEMPKYHEGIRYAILCCQDCANHFVAMQTYGTDWHSVYPILRKSVSKDIPPPIIGDFKEANLCYAVGAYKACVSMCQITVEHVWHEQHVSGLSELKDKGIISPRLYDRANEIRLWGNLAKHELIVDPVSKDDAEQLLGYLEILLSEVYVEPKRLDSLTKKRKELEKED